jgi:hypothetical protein
METIATELIKDDVDYPFYYAFTAEIRPSHPQKHGKYYLYSRYHKLVHPLTSPIQPHTMPKRTITMGFSDTSQVQEVSFSMTIFSKFVAQVTYVQQLYQARNYDPELAKINPYAQPTPKSPLLVPTGPENPQKPEYDIVAQTMSTTQPPWYPEFYHTAREHYDIFPHGSLVTLMPKDTNL